MLDWVRTSEEKISVSRDALSIEQSGKIKQAYFFKRPTDIQRNEFKSKHACCIFPDGSDAFVTGIVLYRNLGSILSFQR